MARDAASAFREPDVVRAAVPVMAAGIVVFVALTDSPGWGRLALLVLTAAVFAGWARWPRLPTLVLTAGVLVPVVLVALEFDSALFLASLLALVVGGWEDSRVLAVGGGVAAVAGPLVVAALPGDDLTWAIWMVGIAFPWVIGFLFHRQKNLTAQLEATRRELLAERAVLEERRRIARDVHDLVGHGLAAVMLQLTSARHVLRRDVDAVDEALHAAEDVGRRSLQELRRSVALLRGEGDDGRAPPLPGAAQLGELVDAARDGGLAVDYRATGDHDVIDPAVGLALYRIAQESLANAARHAPRARTEVSTSVEDGWVVLEVDSVGPVAEPETDASRPRYGLVGMQERAATVGGHVQAGPTSRGWRVRSRMPLNGASGRPAPAGDEAAPR